MSYAPLINSHRRSSRLSSTIRVIIAIVVALFVLRLIAPTALTSFFTMIVKPLWGESDTRSEDSVTIQNLQKIISENQANYLESNSLRAENNHLKELLNRSVATKPILAAILKKPPFSAYDTLILDIGSADGIVVAQPVYALGNIPIGEIAETTAHTSKVKLYSSAGQKFDVLIGEKNIETTAVGQGGGYFEAVVAREARISKGDIVSIPGLKNTFAGKVESAVSDPSEPFSKILLHQPVNIYELKWVLVDVAAK